MLRLLALLLASCVATRQGDLVDCGPLISESQLVTLAEEHRVPILIISNRVYLPASECLRDELTGRIQGDVASQEARVAAVGQEGLGHSERRSIGGAVEKRATHGQVESNRVGGAIESRGGLEDGSRQRSIEGNSERRKVAGRTEDSQVGGEREDRRFAGSILKPSCVKDGDSSFRVVGANASIAVYWRGSFMSVDGNVVSY